MTITDFPVSQLEACEAPVEHEGAITPNELWVKWNTDRYNLSVCGNRHEALVATIRRYTSATE